MRTASPTSSWYDARRVPHYSVDSAGGFGVKALTPKQARFCQAYLETGNASEAYRQAYDASRMKAASVHRLAKNDLHAHHMIEWAAEPEMRFLVHNGVTLCGRCHIAHHRGHRAA